MGFRSGVFVDISQFSELTVAWKYYQWFNRDWPCYCWRTTRGSNCKGKAL